MNSNLEQHQAVSDEELLKAAQTPDMQALVESNLQLRNELRELRKDAATTRSFAVWIFVFTSVTVVSQLLPIIFH